MICLLFVSNFSLCNVLPSASESTSNDDSLRNVMKCNFTLVNCLTMLMARLFYRIWSV